MHRSVSMLLCAAVAFAAFAAPAPVYRTPRASEVWVKGWDETVDPVGGCRFHRDGRRLTVRSPEGKLYGSRVHGWDAVQIWRKAPRLTREVEGDFQVQVRVSGDFGPTGKGFLLAALLLTDGANNCMVCRHATGQSDEGFDGCFGWADTVSGGEEFRIRGEGSPAGRAVRLSLERRGGRVAMRASPDGKEWTTLERRFPIDLLRKVKVGVLAAGTGNGPFTVVFDEFSLTPLK